MKIRNPEAPGQCCRPDAELEKRLSAHHVAIQVLARWIIKVWRPSKSDIWRSGRIAVVLKQHFRYVNS